MTEATRDNYPDEAWIGMAGPVEECRVERYGLLVVDRCIETGPERQVYSTIAEAQQAFKRAVSAYT